MSKRNYYNPGGKRTSAWPNYPLDTVATYWDDIRVAGDTMEGGTIGGPDYEQFVHDGGSSQGVYTYMFDPDTPEEVFFSVQMPHGWKEGTTIYPHLHWAPTTASGGNVRWWFEYSWSNVGDTFPTTTIIKVTAAAEGERKHSIVTFTDDVHDDGGIDATGKTLSSMILCRLVRQADSVMLDTYPADAAILEFDFHYEVDAPGSIREYQKVGDRDSKYRL